jgi:double-strand break repair protein MRE11
MLNYYGRIPASDDITVKPVLLQKGRTKLALYGLSNVRDERLFRTFRDGKVKFFQPRTHKDEWFNLIAVHQNHTAHSETNYLPENFLPDFLDLVIWGHEHECLIDPKYNPEMSFHVIQPGSSVATSLVQAESVHKHVAILSITGKEFHCEPIRLKTVRPFLIKEISLNDAKEMRKIVRQENNRTQITQYLVGVVEKLIQQARDEWVAAQDEDIDPEQIPLPLIRLKVEYSAPDGGRYDCENPQRFSNRFNNKVANVHDVVQFYRKKSSTRKSRDDPDMPEESILAQLEVDKVKVEKLVREFLQAQSLTILPQNSFGDAVSQYVDKDDKHAMEMFVNESLANQIKHLLENDEVEDDDMNEAMETFRQYLEEQFASGHRQRNTKRKYRPKPSTWDSDLDGHWEDTPGALIHTDNEQEDIEQEDQDEDTSVVASSRGGRGRRGPRAHGRGGRIATSSTTRKNVAATTKRAPERAITARGTGRGGRKRVIEEESEEAADSDIIMLEDDDDDEADESLFVRSRQSSARQQPVRAQSTRTAAPKTNQSKTTVSTGKQTTLNFSQAGKSRRHLNIPVSATKS